MATRAASFSDDEVKRSFEEEWPELARRLERFLAAKGVERWLRADVIQETATRLYPRWETLDHSLPLWNLAATIAVRVVHNHRRKESRVELVADPVPIHRDDVHLRGLQRAQLDKTRSALQQLTTDQRRVLLAAVGEARLPAGTRNRINVLRLRARARLREALGPWAPAGVTLRMRSLRAAIERRLAEWEGATHAVAASIASVGVAATLLVAGAGIDGANAGLQESLPQNSDILGLDELRDSNLYSAVTSIRRPENPKLESKAKDRASREAEEQSGPVADTWHQVEDTANEKKRRASRTFRDGNGEDGDAMERVAEEKDETWREVEDILP